LLDKVDSQNIAIAQDRATTIISSINVKAIFLFFINYEIKKYHVFHKKNENKTQKINHHITSKFECHKTSSNFSTFQSSILFFCNLFIAFA
jgi:hypothetical protein